LNAVGGPLQIAQKVKNDKKRKKSTRPPTRFSHARPTGKSLGKVNNQNPKSTREARLRFVMAWGEIGSHDVLTASSGNPGITPSWLRALVACAD